MSARTSEQVKRFRQWQKRQQRRSMERSRKEIKRTVEIMTEIVGGHRLA